LPPRKRASRPPPRPNANRLLEQSRREIEMQVKVGERELVNHAADLAVGVATERIKKNITDDDQQRLFEARLLT